MLSISHSATQMLAHLKDPSLYSQRPLALVTVNELKPLRKPPMYSFCSRCLQLPTSKLHFSAISELSKSTVTPNSNHKFRYHFGISEHPLASG
jgi:hypothetical protein